MLKRLICGNKKIMGSEIYFEAVKGNNIDLVKDLIDNDISYLNEYDDLNSYTALIISSKENKIELVQYLLNKGADVDLQSNKGDTAIIWASDKGHLEVVQMLLKKNPKLDIISHSESTALICAAGL
jgi:ankyrin repeat protein